MTIKRLKILKKNEMNDISKIDEFIEKGGSPSLTEEELKDITFTISIPGKICKIIDELRSVTKMSRRSWLLQAAQDKIKSERNMDII